MALDFNGMFRSFGARLAQEGQRNLAHGVESGQQGCQCQGDEDCQVAAVEGPGENFIFGPEAGCDQWETGQGKPADEEGPEGQRHLLAQTAHVEHVLRIDVFFGVQHPVFHAMNDRTGAQEEQRLEEGMRHQVEGCRYISAHPQGCDHIAQLGDGRESQHPLDVILRHRNRGSEQGSEGADKGHHGQGRGQWIARGPTRRDQREEAQGQVNTR